MTTLNDFIEEQLHDPVFKEKYDALEPEFTVMQAMIDAGEEKEMALKIEFVPQGPRTSRL